MLDGNNEAEALCNIAEQSEERKATIAPGNSRTENEASYQDNIAEVTSVVDDRDNDHKHFEEAVELFEVENKAVEEIFKPIETLTDSVSSWRNCGSPDQGKVRRRHCQE